MQKAVKQAYQAEVLLRSTQMITVGTRYPFKDQVVITTENTYRHSERELFTYSHRIDIGIPCENKLEAMKLHKALREHFQDKKMMLPIHVGVFQKPRTYNNQKARKHQAHATIKGADLLLALPEFQKDKTLAHSIGSSPVESNVLVNGFDLTYMISEFTMEHLIMEEDFDGKPLDTPFYRLDLYTSSVFEDEDGLSNEELIVFSINGTSESEIMLLGEKIAKLQHDKKEILTCKGAFPREQRDYFQIRLADNAETFIKRLTPEQTKKAS